MATLSCLNMENFGGISKGSICKKAPEGTELFQSGDRPKLALKSILKGMSKRSKEKKGALNFHGSSNLERELLKEVLCSLLTRDS